MADLYSPVVPQVPQIQAGTEDDSHRMDTSDDRDVENQLIMAGEPNFQAEATASSSTSNIVAALVGAVATPVKQEPPKPEPLSEYDILRNAVKDDIYSSSKWNRLVTYAEDSKDISKVRETYDWLLQVYPNTVRSTPSHEPLCVAFVRVRTVLDLSPSCDHCAAIRCRVIEYITPFYILVPACVLK